MITKKNYEYILKLKKMLDKLDDAYEKEVFRYAVLTFAHYKEGVIGSKYVTKEAMLKYLVSLKLETMRNNQLPDDRKLRETARKLLKMGYPIIASSKTKGYCIAEELSEIDAPQQENHKRAMNILSVERGYRKIRQLLVGQEEMI